MIYKCCFCDYQKSQALSEDILKVLADESLPQENYLLWVERLVKQSGFSAYNSVKIHMGRMHKEDSYKYISPRTSLEPVEEKILALK